MEKQIRHGRLLEHLESCGTNIKMRGPIVRKLCVGRYRESIKQTKKILKMNFKVFCAAGTY